MMDMSSKSSKLLHVAIAIAILVACFVIATIIKLQFFTKPIPSADIPLETPPADREAQLQELNEIQQNMEAAGMLTAPTTTREEQLQELNELRQQAESL
jgi:hypothetical protein